jgi:triacylglycerol lipase
MVIGLSLLVLIIFLLYSLVPAFITHLIMYYEMRLTSLLDDSKDPIPVFPLLKSFLVESFCNFIRIFLIPFAWITYSSKKMGKGTPVILVHGYMQNQTDWLWVKHKLQRIEGIGPIYTINLHPTFDSISNYGEFLHSKIKQIKGETNQNQVILIGHSMGGLVASYTTEFLATENDIAMVIALAAPYRGTRLAAFGYGQNAKEMSPNSIFLSELSKRMQNSKTPYFFIASKIDNVILPWSSSFPIHDQMGSNRCLILDDHGHLKMLISHRVVQQIETWIKTKVEDIGKADL